jgi:hypothetical protein
MAEFSLSKPCKPANRPRREELINKSKHQLAADGSEPSFAISKKDSWHLLKVSLHDAYHGASETIAGPVVNWFSNAGSNGPHIPIRPFGRSLAIVRQTCAPRQRTTLRFAACAPTRCDLGLTHTPGHAGEADEALGRPNAKTGIASIRKFKRDKEVRLR